jgi:putative phosphoserine phosphatase/1-acylglycerol-3-phosphate O-acyltransferase
MSVYDEVVAEIERLPEGPQIGAFFDFDGTLIAGFSATVFLKEQIRRGDLSPYQLVELVSAVTQFSLGTMGFSGLMTSAAQFMRGVREEDYYAFGQELYEQQIARRIYPESRALVQAHMARGHTVAVISSATPYQVEPMAFDLGFEHVICSRYEVEDGAFTGGIERPLCFGQGKVTAAEKLARELGVDLDQSYFYSDSDDDLELLERVGHPQPLNPNSRLAVIAEERGWPIRRFKSRGQPQLTDYLRSVAATVSLLPSFAAGLPIWALTGSKSEARNFATSIFADVSSALIGLNLVVRGEHHLWENRPAVFVFNHQSKVDVVIMARLLRRDIAGVGKKEIQHMPLIGKTLELAGTVFIDRQNSASAIQAMKPLVDAMRNQGKSVVIAPEGTRTITPKLAPFKKGPFHLAMQAGVPMVPVVIHNAGDVAPKGDFVFRKATVEVDVLPPVDTSEWRAETIEEHLAEVRGMFLEKLGQSEDSPALPKEPVRKTTPGKKTIRKKKASKSAAADPVTTRYPGKTGGQRKAGKKAATKKAVKKKAVKKKVAAKKTVKKAPARETSPGKTVVKKEAPIKKDPKEKDLKKKGPKKKVLKKKAVIKKEKAPVAAKAAPARRKPPRPKPLRKKVLSRKSPDGSSGGRATG